MNRILAVEYAYLKLINEQEGKLSHRDQPLDWERVHMASSARIGYELARKRGTDPETAAIATAIHDIGRVLSGMQAGHAEAGYEPAKAFLSVLGMFTDEEIELIAGAVRTHSSKTVIGTPIQEIVKDADVIDAYHLGEPFDRPEKEERYQKLMKEI